MGLAAKNAKSAKKTWPMVRLGDVCEILDSRRVPITKKDRVAGEIPYYGATGIVDYVSSYIFDERLVLLGEDGARWGANEDSAFIIEGKTWVNNHAHVLRVRDNIADEYLVYYLNFADLNMYITGVTVPKLNQQRMKEITIPLPPLSVQREIVTRLEKELGEADALAAKFKEIAENADAEFKAELDETFKNVEGEKVRLGDVCEFMRRGKSPTYCESSPYPMFAQKCNQPTHITLEKCKFCEASKFLKFSKEYRLRDYDIVVNSTGTGTLGRVGLFRSKYLVPYGYEVIVADSHVMIVRPSKKAVPAYLYWYMKQDWVYQWMNENANGSTNQKELYPQTLGRLDVPLTNVETQRAISTKLDTVREKCDRLKAAAERGLRAAEDLRKAILAEAFEQ